MSYHQPTLTGAVNLAGNRSLGFAVRARSLFREIALICVIYNINRFVTQRIFPPYSDPPRSYWHCLRQQFVSPQTDRFTDLDQIIKYILRLNSVKLARQAVGESGLSAVRPMSSHQEHATVT